MHKAQLAVFFVGTALTPLLAFAQSVSEHEAQRTFATELSQATQAFRAKLPSLPQFVEIKKQAEEKAEALDAARVTGDQALLSASIKAKVSADKAVQATIDRLQAEDAGIAAVNKKVSTLAAEFDARLRPEAVTAAAQQQQAAEALEQRRAKYRAVVDRDPSDPLVKIEKIPLRGDEILFSEPRARPREFVNRPFIVAGVLEISDYYNFGYSEAKPIKYAFAMDEVRADTSLGHSAHLYIDRNLGGGLVGAINARDKNFPEHPFVMRVKMTIDPKYARDFGETSDMYEVLDWQILGKDGAWTPWYSEILGLGGKE